MRLAILQPMIPHYRDEFFSHLRKDVEQMDLYTYENDSKSEKAGFNIGQKSEHIANIEYHGLLLYAPWKLLSKRYDTLVLMLHQGHITTWLLLLTKWLHRKKIVVWGQGISVKRYLKEEKKPSRWLKWQIALADGAWIYMEKEADMWRKRFPQKPIVALNNSVSNITEMLDYDSSRLVETLKQKYNITEEVIFIFCARFGSPFRRVDLMEQLMQRLDKKKYGFIIIGDGKGKPDFSKYSNVHDFGAIYDDHVKRELFTIADAYLQPGWIGLSVVEAMAYRLPVCTFKRKGDEIRHGVEYGILKDGVNAMLFDSIEEAVRRIEHISTGEFVKMGNRAHDYIAQNHTPKKMVENAMKVLERI